jgi:hypothetical protein
VLAACDHAEPSAKKAPPPAPKPDPVQEARDQFELVSEDLAAGTSKLYSRGDFLPESAGINDDLDEGDFIGRLRTLFGPRQGDDYVLRDKKTGVIITAYSGNSGPSYGGTPEDAGREARRAADPLLKGEMPSPEHLHQYRRFVRHLDDALAGPAAAAVVGKLDALVSAVPPADFSETKYYDEEPTVYRFGAKGGHSFAVDLPPEEALAFLLHSAESGNGDDAVLEYYAAHKDALADQKPKVVAAYQRFVAAARKADPDMRDALLDEARELKP